MESRLVAKMILATRISLCVHMCMLCMYLYIHTKQEGTLCTTSQASGQHQGRILGNIKEGQVVEV